MTFSVYRYSLLALVLLGATKTIAFTVSKPSTGRHHLPRPPHPVALALSCEDDDDSQTHEMYWLEKKSSDDDVLYGFNDDDDLLFGNEAQQHSIGQSIGQGQVVLCLPQVASAEECQTLFQAALQAAQNQGPSARGRSRLSVSDPTVFSGDIVMTTEEILLRVLDYIDENLPSIYEWLFEPSDEWVHRQPLNAQLEQPDTPPESFLRETCPTLRDLYMMGALEWSEGEPAINIYQAGGYFGAHKDHLALTVLIPLTSAEGDFQGGGTGFWAGNRQVDENPSTPPDLILKPAPGSALLFGGDVTHAGMPVASGLRSVGVCSFSTPASSPDRLHGLQAPPQVSANFKGTV